MLGIKLKFITSLLLYIMLELLAGNFHCVVAMICAGFVSNYSAENLWKSVLCAVAYDVLFTLRWPEDSETPFARWRGIHLDTKSIMERVGCNLWDNTGPSSHPKKSKITSNFLDIFLRRELWFAWMQAESELLAFLTGYYSGLSIQKRNHWGLSTRDIIQALRNWWDH